MSLTMAWEGRSPDPVGNHTKNKLHVWDKLTTKDMIFELIHRPFIQLVLHADHSIEPQSVGEPVRS